MALDSDLQDGWDFHFQCYQAEVRCPTAPLSGDMLTILEPVFMIIKKK